MEHQLTPAGLAGLFNSLGTYGIYVRPVAVEKTNVYGEAYRAASDTVVEAHLAHDNGITVIRLVADLSDGTVTIITAEETISVSSYFHNGSGPFFRDENGTEFCSVQMDGYVYWFRKGQRDAKWLTPAGSIDEARRREREGMQRVITDILPKSPEPVI